MRLGLTILLFSISLFVFGQNLLTNQIAVKFQESLSNGKVENKRFIKAADISNRASVQKIIPLQKSTANLRTSETSILNGIHIITCENILATEQLCDELRAYPNVIYAEPIYQEQLLLVPNDPDARQGGNQEYLEVIKAYEAWDINQGDPNLVIGIIDSGLDLLHEDIANNVYINQNEIPNNGIDDDNNGYIDDYQGYDFADNDPNPQSETSYHGNRVGGVAGAVTNNEIGIAGIGFNTKISPLKAFQTTSNISAGNYEAIIYAADNNYDVINLSWGSASSYSQFNQDVINYAVLEKDVVVVAAAGNTPEELDFYPASYDHVLSVSASELDDSKASFATFSTKVDLVAPGNQIYSSFKDNAYARDNGTSYSTPMVAGAAALLRAEHPELNALQVMELLRVNTDNIYTLAANTPYFEKLGTGRLNIEKALLKEHNKSLRITEASPSGLFDGYIFFDDSISLNLSLTNYLDVLANAKLSISSPSNYVSVITSDFALGRVSQSTITDDLSRVIYLDENTPPGEEIVIRIGINDAEYLDYQYLKFKTQGDFLSNKNANFSMTIAGNGNIGYADDGLTNGNGIVWKGQKIADNIGLAISANNVISDNWPLEKDGIIRSRDFFTEKYIKLQNQDYADFTTQSVFADATANNPLRVTIEQKSFSFDSTLLGNGMILQSRLINTSSDTIKGLKIGLFSNWKLPEFQSNQSYFDKGLLVTKNNSGTIFTGIKLYGEAAPIYQAIDVDNFNGNSLEIPLDFSDSLKIALLQKSTYDSAGFIGNGNDILNILSSKGDTLLVGASVKKAFFIAAAPTLDSLILTMSQLEQQYKKILAQPPLLEKIISCEGAKQIIIPEVGNDFRFYTDPFGSTLITENDSLVISGISKDSSIYVQKVGDNYLDDFQRIDIQLTTRVSDFRLSTDTLYLDDPKKNVVQFTDLSFVPLSWLWDFGNGTQASIQNPSMVFNQPGSYQISLTVENEVGCIDVESKTLFVTTRPSLPEIENSLICKGESVVLQTVNKDLLRLYTKASDALPAEIGTEITIENIQKDTTYFISRIVDGLESLKKETTINLSSVKADFSFSPDLTEETPSVLLLNESMADSIQWQVVGNTYFTDSVSIPITTNSLSISLEAFNVLGCNDTKTSLLQFSESPTPTLQFSQPCFGENIILEPQNGTFFGLYADQSLSTLISKGKKFELQSITDTINYFIVSLDSILPSEPITVNIAPIIFETQILSDPAILYLDESKKVSFSTVNNSTIQWNWLLNNELFEIVSKPIVFFDSVGNYEIVLNTKSINGCQHSDTLIYEVIQSRPITLSTPKTVDFKLFPNPATNELIVQSTFAIEKIIIMSVGGKELMHINTDQNLTEKLNINKLKSGIYILKAFTSNGIFTEVLYKVDQ